MIIRLFQRAYHRHNTVELYNSVKKIKSNIIHYMDRLITINNNYNFYNKGYIN